MKHIAILASGSGTNAENMARYFSHSVDIRVSLVLTNNPRAGVIDRAEALGLPLYRFTREDLNDNQRVLQILKQHETDLVVLAGFLWLLPLSMIQAYPQRIVNIHPALLPAYGGKGMYGHHVHRAVIQNREPRSGITIHLVDEVYDHGAIIFQATCRVLSEDTPDSLAARIHELEYAHYPRVIEDYLKTIG